MPTGCGEPIQAILACTSSRFTLGSRSTLFVWVWATGHWVFAPERRWSGSGSGLTQTTTN